MRYAVTGDWPTPEEVEPAWIESKNNPEDSVPQQAVEPVGAT